MVGSIENGGPDERQRVAVAAHHLEMVRLQKDSTGIYLQSPLDAESTG